MTQIQINLINAIKGSLIGTFNIVSSDYPIISIDTLREKISKFVKYDICTFFHDIIILRPTDVLSHFITQNRININVIYDSEKKARQLDNDYNRFINMMLVYMNKQIFRLIETKNKDEIIEFFREFRHRIDSLMIEYDETKFKFNPFKYLSSPLERKKPINMELYNLNSILSIPIEKFEYMYRIMTRDEFIEYWEYYR